MCCSLLYSLENNNKKYDHRYLLVTLQINSHLRVKDSTFFPSHNTAWRNNKSLLWSLERAMAPHSSTLAWKILWMEEPGRLQSMGSLQVGYDWATSLSIFTFHFHALEKEMATHSSVLAWRIPGTGDPGGLPSMGLHRVGHDWSDLAVAAAKKSKRKYHLYNQFK